MRNHTFYYRGSFNSYANENCDPAIPKEQKKLLGKGSVPFLFSKEIKITDKANPINFGAAVNTKPLLAPGMCCLEKVPLAGVQSGCNKEAGAERAVHPDNQRHSLYTGLLNPSGDPGRLAKSPRQSFLGQNSRANPEAYSNSERLPSLASPMGPLSNCSFHPFPLAEAIL